MSTAALIASVVAGCSSGGGTAADFELPELPGATPTVKTMEFTLEKYGLADNAVVLVSTTGKDETYDKTKDVTLTTSYVNAEAEESAEKYAEETAGKNTLLDEGDEAADEGGDEEEQVGDMRYNYRCAFQDSVKYVNRLLADGASHKDSQPATLARFDGQDVGYISKVYPPSVVTKSGTSIYVKKIVDDKYTANCNILYQCDKDGTTDVQEYLGEFGIDLAKAFDDNVNGTGKGIYQTLTEAFGHEWRYSPSGGRDGDQRINIVICDNDAMGGHLGAVRFCDAFPASQVATSNAGEFIFLNATKMAGLYQSETTGKLGIGVEIIAIDPETDEPIYGYYGPTSEFTDSLAHQLTHLIEMNSKVIHEGKFDDFELGETKAADTVERIGISEGLGELAGEICGGGVNGDIYSWWWSVNDINIFMGGEDWQTGVENSVCAYNNLYQNGGSIFSNDRGNTSECVYGGSHMFMLWLYENFGLTNISKILKSPDTGMTNLASAMGEEANELFHGFNRMVYLCQYDNAPEDAQINSLPVPIVRGTATIDESIPGISVLYDHTLRNDETMAVAPWSAKLIGIRPGEESERNLKVKVRFPANGGVSVFRLKNGDFVEDVEGVEVRDNQDRQR